VGSPGLLPAGTARRPKGTCSPSKPTTPVLVGPAGADAVNGDLSMPLYEYLCPDCQRVFTFMLPTMGDAETPACPRCGGVRMERQLSRFAFVRGGTDPLAALPGTESVGGVAGPERDESLYIVRAGRVEKAE
jgi:putative FmdB family regulatory protein